MTEDTKQCPLCGETIKANAKKCRFCNTWLDDNKLQDTSEAAKINCPTCGAEISANANCCKFCGVMFEDSVHSDSNNSRSIEQKTKPQEIFEKNTKQCPFCGEEILAVAQKCRHCGEWLNVSFSNSPCTANAYNTIRTITNMQQASNILWIVFSILMAIIGHFLISIEKSWFGITYMVIAAANAFMISSWFKLPNKIIRQDADVPYYYDNLASLIVTLVINLALGWIIGVILICFDLYIRSEILKNKNLFTNHNY